jgi:hypothetical protein
LPPLDPLRTMGLNNLIRNAVQSFRAKHAA